MNTTKAGEKVKYSAIVDKTRSIVDKKNVDREDKLQEICDLLQDSVQSFDWIGFYLPDPHAERELVLGPFNGEPTEHTRIPYGKGICGQSAETNETFIVQDVNKADNYLSCSIDVKAEIVVPIIKNGTFVAELDIDSHTKNSIFPKHRELLEKICDVTAALF